MDVRRPGRDVLRQMWRAHKARLITCTDPASLRQPTASELRAAWAAPNGEPGEAC